MRDDHRYLDALHRGFFELAGAPVADPDRFSSFFRVRTFGERDTVVSPARSGNDVFFVAEGLVRFFYLDEDAESDRLFSTEGQFARAVTASALGLPYGCQALEPSVVLTAPYDALTTTFQNDRAFVAFDRTLSRQMLALKDRHVWSLQTLSAADRLADFAQRFPHLVDRVPQYHIARYLGMSPISYSRLKKSLRPS